MKSFLKIIVGITFVFSMFGCQKQKEEQPSLVGIWSCVRLEDDTDDVFICDAYEMNYVFQFYDNEKYTWDSSEKMGPGFHTEGTWSLNGTTLSLTNYDWASGSILSLTNQSFTVKFVGNDEYYIFTYVKL